MKPRRHKSHKAKVVVYFDANMPEVRNCHYGCSSERTCICRHRFGPRIWFVAKTKALMRMKDLEVIEDFVATVRKHWADKHGAIEHKHYVLATHDEDFLADAKGQYRKKLQGGKIAQGEQALTFGAGWVQSGDGPDAVHITLFLGPKNTRSRDLDLLAVLQHCRQLRHTDVSRPH